MNESSLRGKFRNIVAGFPGHVTNHEDKFIRGVFDCSYVFRDEARTPHSGWVEFKYLPTTPKLPTTKLNLGIRPEQVLWAESRIKHGDLMFLMIRIVDTIYLFDAKYIRELHDRVSMSRLESLWTARWEKSINQQELRECLSGQ